MSSADRIAPFLRVLALACLPLAPATANPTALDRRLTSSPGDPMRGRAIVADRQKGMCLLCHTGPFPETPFQGSLAPSLAGAGARLSEGELRQRMVDGRAVNPDTIMPPYFSSEGLVRVSGPGRPLLAAQEIEDVVAFLATLREP